MRDGAPADGGGQGLLSLIAPVLASSAYVLEIALVPLLLPALRSEAGLSTQELTLVVNVYAVAVPAGVLLCGAFGDRVGPARMFLLGTLAFVAGSIATALSGSFETMLAGRVLQGFGGGLFSPVVPVLLATVGGARPGRFLSLWNSFSGMLLAIAPLLALPLLAFLGWQAVFVALALLVALSLLLFLRSSLASRASEAAPARDAPRLMQSVGRLLGNPATTLLLAYVGLTYGIAILFLFNLPLNLAAIGGDTLQSAWALGAFWASFTLVGAVQSTVIDGRHSRVLLTASPLVMLGGFLLFLFGGLPVTQTGGAAVTGLGFALGNATSTMLILRHAPAGTSATAASLDITFARLGSVVTVALLAALPETGLAAGIAAIGLAAAIMASFVRRMPIDAPAPRETP